MVSGAARRDNRDEAAQTDSAELVTLREAARRTRIGLRQLYQARDRGEFPVFDLGWPRVRWADILSWIARHERPRSLSGGGFAS